jgi:hypothetical protein
MEQLLLVLGIIAIRIFPRFFENFKHFWLTFLTESAILLIQSLKGDF